MILEDWGPGVGEDIVYAHSSSLRTLLVDQALSRVWGLVWPTEDRPKLHVVAPDLRVILPDEAE